MKGLWRAMKIGAWCGIGLAVYVVICGAIGTVLGAIHPVLGFTWALIAIGGFCGALVWFMLADEHDTGPFAHRKEEEHDG